MEDRQANSASGFGVTLTEPFDAAIERTILVERQTRGAGKCIDGGRGGVTRRVVRADATRQSSQPSTIAAV